MIDPKIQAELRAKYNPDGSPMRELQLRTLDILKYIDELCQKHDIKYWLSSGNCIGLVRHGGFIPWDYDVDVEMLREDYLKFEKVFKETDDFLQYKTYDDEKDFPPSAFGKLTQNQLEKIEGTIPKDSKVQEFIPEIIKKDFSEKIDWNYNTVLSTVQKFDILRPKHPELKMKDFWQALLRGGIQGAVYFSDSTK
jgi:phosphorylcholine metabolism protein LicD